MDSFFGIGLPELVVILILAGIVMGPQRIGQAARWLGRTTAQLQLISRSFVRQLNAELEAVDGADDLKGAVQDIQEMQRQLAELRSELRSATRGAVSESEQALREPHEALRRSIKPPTLSPGTVERKEGASGKPRSQSTNGTSPSTKLPNPIDVPDDPE